MNLRQFFISSIFVIFSQAAGAQERPHQPTYAWIGAGFGIGGNYPTSAGNVGVSGVFEATLKRSNTIYSLKGNSVSEFTTDTQNAYNSVKSLGLTAGRVFDSKGKFQMSLAAGPSIVKMVVLGNFIGYGYDEEGKSVANYEQVTSGAAGGIISTKFSKVTSPGFSYGLELFVNVNKIRSFYGMTFSFQIGAIRTPLNSERNIQNAPRTPSAVFIAI